MVHEECFGGERLETTIAEPLPTMDLGFVIIPIMPTTKKPVRLQTVSECTNIRLEIPEYVFPSSWGLSMSDPHSKVL